MVRSPNASTKFFSNFWMVRYTWNLEDCPTPPPSIIKISKNISPTLLPPPTRETHNPS